MILQDGDKIIFTGDSVTDGGRARPIGEGRQDGVGQGYVRQIENILHVLYPELKLRLINTGISGNKSRELLMRWDQDVLMLQPDYVSIMIGINDVWRWFDCPDMETEHVSLEEYHDNLCGMIEKTLPKVKGIIMISPYYIENQPKDQMLVLTKKYIAVCEEVAKKYGCIYVDVQKTFEEYLQYRHSSYVAWDRVHPGPIGSLIIAKEFCKAIKVDRALFGGEKS